MPSLHHQEQNIPLADLPARIAVVADTHSRPHPELGDSLARLTPRAILHAGDIGNLAVLDPLREIAPLIVVRGNIDGRRAELPDTVAVSLEAPGSAPLRLLLMHIAIARTRLQPHARQLAREHRVQLVVCGHSHAPFLGRDGDIAVFNPGSCGPRRFRLPITYGVLELTDAGLDLRHVDLETGERWRPEQA